MVNKTGSRPNCSIDVVPVLSRHSAIGIRKNSLQVGFTITKQLLVLCLVPMIGPQVQIAREDFSILIFRENVHAKRIIGINIQIIDPPKQIPICQQRLDLFLDIPHKNSGSVAKVSVWIQIMYWIVERFYWYFNCSGRCWRIGSFLDLVKECSLGALLRTNVQVIMQRFISYDAYYVINHC